MKLRNLIFGLAALAMFSLRAGGAPAEFFVAPHGADVGPGSKAGPFATLLRAQQAVRAELVRETVMPRLGQLLVVRGTAERLVRNLLFRGITFAHTDWALPKHGFLPDQAGFLTRRM